MKKLLLTTAFFIVLITVSAQYETFDKCRVEFTNHPNSDGKLTFETDSIKFDFAPGLGTFDITVQNKTNNICSVDWEEGIFDIMGNSGRILFGDDSELTKDRSKLPTKIISGSYIKKTIVSSTQLHSGYVSLIYDKRNMKKNNVTYRCKLILPINFGELKKDYEFDFKISYVGKS